MPCLRLNTPLSGPVNTNARYDVVDDVTTFFLFRPLSGALQIAVLSSSVRRAPLCYYYSTSLDRHPRGRLPRPGKCHEAPRQIAVAVSV